MAPIDLDAIRWGVEGNDSTSRDFLLSPQFHRRNPEKECDIANLNDKLRSVSKQKGNDELMQLFRTRIKDRQNFNSRRKKQLALTPKKLSDILDGYFKDDQEALKRIEENRALLAWTDLVGDSASQVSKALRIRGFTLVVRVNDPLWMQQLMLLKHQLLKKYRASFPKLRLDNIFFTRK